MRDDVKRLDRLLTQLEAWTVRRGIETRPLVRLLERAGRLEIPDARRLSRLHEALLFLRAYPHDRRVMERAERLLGGFPARVARLERAGKDLSLFDELEQAGVAGTTIATEFSYAMARWLARFPGVEASWQPHDQPDRLGEGLPRFVPLLEEEALADAVVPHVEWLEAAAGSPSDGGLQWLLEAFERLQAGEREKSELFDSLGVIVSWPLGRSRYSRTLLRKRGPASFFHPGPLLSRHEVDFAGIMGGPPMPLRRLSRREGERMIDVARGTTAARYREFYGFTHGDPGTGISARPGRGVEIFFFGARPEARLPLRATHTAIVFKNGVAVAYYEGLSFFERMEAGYNVYYTFREGESAWVYAQILRLCHQVAGVTSFSVDAYQIGYDNKEAIDSGAFWFYRKLGFRPTDPKVAALVAREEKRVAANPKYRTPAGTLRRIATCNLLFELRSNPKSEIRNPKSVWDRFHIRNLGLAVNRRMAREFGGTAERIRRASSQRVARALGVSLSRFRPVERSFFESWMLLLDLLPDLSRWSREEKRDLVAVIRAKAGRDEAQYLRRMQRHRTLRQALIKLGSRRR